MARLKREAEECEEIAPEKRATAKVARTAHERLLKFSPYLGAEWRCPDCFAIGIESTLRPNIRRFVETGDGALDVFRSSACGYKVFVPA